LLARLNELRPGVDSEWFALIVRLGPAALSLVGCPTNDLAMVPAQLMASGVNVRPPGVVHDGDFVAFCISCLDGPTQGSREAVTGCAYRTIAPIAIVLTQAELIDPIIFINVVAVALG